MTGIKPPAEKEFEYDMELSGHRRPGSAFLEKLYDILEDERYQDYISWCSDGTSILIKKVEEFSQIVLPRYYKHNNFQSFVRQLNMYNFTKTSHDANWREFKQPLFRKNKRDLLPLIMRKTQATNNSSKDSAEKRSRQENVSVSCGSDEDRVSELTELRERVAHLEEIMHTLCQCPNMPVHIKDMCKAYIKPPQVAEDRIYRQYSEDPCRNKKRTHTMTKSNVLRHTTSLESYMIDNPQLHHSCDSQPIKRQRSREKTELIHTNGNGTSHRASTDGVDAILSAAQILTRKVSHPESTPPASPTTPILSTTSNATTPTGCCVTKCTATIVCTGSLNDIDEDSCGRSLCRQNSCFKNE